jgi:hypothetical protein
MITYNLRTPIGCENSGCVGVVGENLFATEVFKINGLTDKTLSYSIHLRFSDGSVNSIIPDEVAVDSEGTTIKWIIKKNDIFIHGYFELQIEGRNSEELVFQTEIVRLYADESIPIEDKEYSNPNSENIKLREETYNLLSETKLQQSQIDKNLKSIWNTDLSNKEDTTNKYSTNPSGTDRESYYPSLAYLDNYYYTQEGTDELLNKKADTLTFDTTPTIGSNNPVTSHGVAAALSNKADSKSVSAKANKATTLAGYGITDAYTKTEITTSLNTKEDVVNKISSKDKINDIKVQYPSISYLDSYYYDCNEVDDEINNALSLKADKAATLEGYGITDAYTKDEVEDNYLDINVAMTMNSNIIGLQSSKYDSSNVESGVGVFSYDESIATLSTNEFAYQRVGDFCFVQLKISTSTAVAANKLTLSGLPYVSKYSGIRQLFVTSGYQNKYAVTAYNSSNIKIASSLDAGDAITATFVYKIA